MTFEETFENLPDKDKELAKEAASMEEIQEIAESENARLSLDDLDAAAGGGGEPWKQCKKYAARCRKYDKTFILRCPMYTDRGWD